jgi:hypothetical protein
MRAWLPSIPKVDGCIYEAARISQLPLFWRCSEQLQQAILAYKPIVQVSIEPVYDRTESALPTYPIAPVRHIVEQALYKIRRRDIAGKNFAVCQAATDILEHSDCWFVPTVCPLGGILSLAVFDVRLWEIHDLPVFAGCMETDSLNMVIGVHHRKRRNPPVLKARDNVRRDSAISSRDLYALIPLCVDCGCSIIPH